MSRRPLAWIAAVLGAIGLAASSFSWRDDKGNEVAVKADGRIEFTGPNGEACVEICNDGHCSEICTE